LLARENLPPEIGEPRAHRRIGQCGQGRRSWRAPIFDA
jgi:hypothetical protein